MNDTVQISYQLFTECINALDQAHEVLQAIREHRSEPKYFRFQPYFQLEQDFKKACDFRCEAVETLCVGVMEALFDETAEQIHYIAID